MPPLKVREKCGVFGIYAPGEDVGRLTYMGLFALQHRGQESAGIAITDGRTIVLEKDRGLVAEVFTPERQQRLHGKLAIGHVLYGNTDTQSNVENAEPLAVMSRRGSLALAHNGEITNADALRAELSRRGYLFRTDSDIEVIASLIAQAEDPDLTSALISTLRKLNGAYALVVLTPDRIMGIRDPHGIRPLSLGRFDGGYVLASETCAFDTVGAQFIRPVEPGELVTIGPDGISSQRFAPGEKAVCTLVYLLCPPRQSDRRDRCSWRPPAAAGFWPLNTRPRPIWLFLLPTLAHRQLWVMRRQPEFPWMQG